MRWREKIGITDGENRKMISHRTQNMETAQKLE